MRMKLVLTVLALVIDGKTQSAHGTACREHDSRWRVES
jgi:surface antigen